MQWHASAYRITTVAAVASNNHDTGNMTRSSIHTTKNGGTKHHLPDSLILDFEQLPPHQAQGQGQATTG
jgi:hypothetical protein